jgi:hypothetical protein
MDPITLSMLTAAVTVLGTKVAEGAATEAGKSIWFELMRVFGWKEQPNASELAKKIAEYLNSNPQDTPRVLELLKKEGGTASRLTGPITAKNVAISEHVDTLNMS